MIVDEESFLLYAGKHYDTRKSVSANEFTEDLKRFRYLKRLLKKYEVHGSLRTRLILNHIIILYNCFGHHATTMMFYKLEGYHHSLKPFLMFLNYLPKKVYYEDTIVLTSDIPVDINIVNELRKI